MSHYKNRKPKKYLGCCPQCAGRKTDGRPTKRRVSIQELRACPPVEDWETDLDLLKYDDWAHADGWDPDDETFREAGLCSRDCPTCREDCGMSPYPVERGSEDDLECYATDLGRRAMANLYDQDEETMAALDTFVSAVESSFLSPCPVEPLSQAEP